MLSQSDIFNRLPISPDQKAQLFKDLIDEWRIQGQLCQSHNCPMLAVQDAPVQAETQPEACNSEPELTEQEGISSR